MLLPRPASASSSASSSFLSSGDPAETDYTAVGCAVTTISSNLTEMSRGVKLLAALLEDEGGNGRPLLQAAKGLAGAVSELLRSAQPASAEVRATGRAGEGGHTVPPQGGRAVENVTQEPVSPVGTRPGTTRLLTVFLLHSPVRTCCRQLGTWARPVGSCCSKLGKVTLTPTSRLVMYPAPRTPATRR